MPSISSRSAPSRAAWQAPYPSRPLIPTSNGLSYWMCSLPRRLCPIGAAIFSARAITSSCAAAVPAPAKIVTFLAPLIACASARTDSASGITRGDLGRVRMSGAACRASRSATSPGRVRTATPGAPYAW